MKSLYLACLVLALGSAVRGKEIAFSIDPASPSIDVDLTPDDVLESGPFVQMEGSTLGLQEDFFGGEFDNLDALSFGRDFVPPQPRSTRVWFSVDRVAVGLAGTDVNAEAAPGSEEAAGDIFAALPPASSNKQFADEEALGLVPGLFGDDLDALVFGSGKHTYFSIDLFSAGNDFGAKPLANDIFLDSFDPDFPSPFAEGEAAIGLHRADDLDALALWDRGEIGVMEAGIDRALFSLSAFSPNATTSGGTFFPADILFTDFSGNFSVWASAGDLGLRADDELDALTTRVPETASSFGLLIFGLAALVAMEFLRRSRSTVKLLFLP